MRIRTILTLAALLTPAVGQLQGGYTIDANGTGPRNYRELQTAIDAAASQGVAGAVEFVLAPGTYVGNFEMPGIPGASRTRRVTFRSAVPHRAILRPATSNETILSTRGGLRSRGIVLDGLRLAGGRYAIFAAGDDWEVKNCIFWATDYVNLTIRGANWNVHHCSFDSKGPLGRCLEMVGVESCSIHHNEFLIDNAHAILISTGRSANPPTRIYNNLVEGKPRGASEGAITLKTPAFDVEVVHNTILCAGGICLSIDAQLGRPARAWNNIFMQTGGGFCVAVKTLASGYYILESNLYAQAGANAVRAGNTIYRELAAWQRASGQDARSLRGDPRFVSEFPGDYRVQLASKATGNATATPGYVRDDYLGTLRIRPDTIGAYEPKRLTSFEVWGTGCAGEPGTPPRIGYAGDLQPRSTTFRVTLGNARRGPGVPAFLVVGAFRQTSQFGGGCDLLVAPHIVTLLHANAGRTEVRVPLPGVELKGAQSHLQWAVVDPAAAGVGLAFSNAATVTL